MSQYYLVFDFETKSECDLRKSGAFEYAAHPSTQILCVAWCIGTKEELKTASVKVWSPTIGGYQINEFITFLNDQTIKLVAHNASFERFITQFVLSRRLYRFDVQYPNPDRWICTASLARAMALPGKLEGAAMALDLPHRKDAEGHRLMLKMCKPRKPTKTDPVTRWHESPGDVQRLMEYCASDIKAEVDLFLRLPPLSPKEREIWLLDQKMNARGFCVDRDLVTTALKMIDAETKSIDRETEALTLGCVESARKRDQVLEWLTVDDVKLENLQSKTVSDTIAKDAAPLSALSLLKLRQGISKASTAKYKAFEARTRHDGRSRDNLIYHVASTGRWGGSGAQIQNLYRSSIRNTTQAADLVLHGDLELLRLTYGAPMEVLASCLRSVIIPSAGRSLFCADYAAIEARIAAWIAKSASGVRAYVEGKPIYEIMASGIYGKPVSEISKLERQVGKIAELGCQFGMGGVKFQATCEKQGVIISESLAKRSVNAYRESHPEIVSLWRKFEKAAIAAVRNRQKIKLNFTTWWCDDGFLFCELPSGRRLAYRKPEVRFESKFGREKTPVLYFWSQNSVTKRWEIAPTWGGIMVQNCIQAVARDLMADSMLRVEAAGYEVLITVHDEVLSEKQNGDLSEFLKLMSVTPAWAEGLPVKVEGWAGNRYRKG